MKKQLACLSLLIPIFLLSGCSQAYDANDVSKPVARYNHIRVNHNDRTNHLAFDVIHLSSPYSLFSQRENKYILRYDQHEAPIANRKFSDKYGLKYTLYPRSADGMYWCYFFTHPCNMKQTLTELNTAQGNKNEIALKLYRKSVDATLARDDTLAKVKTREKPMLYFTYLHKKRFVKLDNISGVHNTHGFDQIERLQKHYWRYYFTHQHPHLSTFKSEVSQ